MAFGIFLFRAIVGGRRDDIVSPCPVCRYTVERIFPCFFYFSGCGVQDIRGSGTRISIVILQAEEVLLPVKYPVGCTDGFRAVAQYRHATFVECLAGDEISTFVCLGCNDVFACTRSRGAAIAIASAGSGVVVALPPNQPKSSQGGAEGGSKRPSEESFFHVFNYLLSE